MKRIVIKTMTVLLLAAMAAGLCPAALAKGGFQAVVTVVSMKVYDTAKPHDLLGKLPVGTEVTVLDYSGEAALIQWNGRKGLARVSDLEPVSRSAEPAASNEAETASASELKNARTMVTSANVRVYRSASTSADYVKVDAGVQLNVLSTSDGWARVERNGAVGYTRLSGLTETASGDSGFGDSVVYYDRKAMMAAETCKVYSGPSTSSACVTVEKGTALTLLAVKGSVAQVERNGKLGYMEYAKLIEVPAQTTDVTTAEITMDDSKIFSGSNEQIIFKFLVREAGYSVAAACGVVANIKYESGFKPTCVGDAGTSYGICQWHLGRKTRLISWCKSNGYDYTTLKGQLYYLKHELKTYYPSVHNYIKGVSNSAKGAYEAGYYFCYHFEAPASRETRSVTRATYAMNTLWDRYKT